MASRANVLPFSMSYTHPYRDSSSYNAVSSWSQIIDTYKEYKLKERKVTSWLRKMGEKLGHFSNSRNRDLELHPVPISEIPSVVELITSWGFSINEQLRQNLRDVISLRREAGSFYRTQQPGEADRIHAYYVGVLEDTFKTFEKFRKDTAGTSPTVRGECRSQKKTELSNLFELLDIEGRPSDAVSNEESESENESQKTGKIKSGKKRARPEKQKKITKSKEMSASSTEVDVFASITMDRKMGYENDEEDLYFMIYCLFIDWNVLREYLQERW